MRQKHFNRILIILTFNITYATTSINAGLPGIAETVTKLQQTLCGPIAFILSCAGLISAAAVWKFVGHSAGLRYFAAVIAGCIIITNAAAWASALSGVQI